MMSWAFSLTYHLREPLHTVLRGLLLVSLQPATSTCLTKHMNGFHLNNQKLSALLFSQTCRYKFA
jgi:hypothetical protein